MDEIYSILVVDDTVTYRRILAEVVNGIPQAKIIGSAPNGRIALAKIEQSKPDLILLDVEMPELNGLDTLRIVKERYPEICVVIISGVSERQADYTIKALELGAIDFLPKPQGLGYEESIDQLRRQISSFLQFLPARRLNALTKKTIHEKEHRQIVSRVKTSPSKTAASQTYIAATPDHYDVIAIGTSTGGPDALMRLIPNLHSEIKIPILLVQHMPPVFTASLAKNLDTRSPLCVKEAVQGEDVKPGIVYVAPGGRHMIVQKRPANQHSIMEIGLNDEPPVNSCRPSADILFRSVAENYGGNILAVVLTGMGADGTDGVAAMKRQGCYCITQSAETCVVYGMPRALNEAGFTDEIVDVGNIANRINHLLKMD